ncbi:MAG: hypothetical protein ABSB79_15130 [Syntrophales bacterium]
MRSVSVFLLGFYKQLNTFDSVEDAVVDFFPKLWAHYQSYDIPQTMSAWRQFQLFNKKILSSIPYYRDHFVHQFIVFLLGAVILDRLNNLPDLAKCYPAYRNLQEEKKKAKIEHAWVMTSLFHDVAYPLQTSNKWFWDIIRAFIGEDSCHPMRNLPVDTVLYNPDYIDSIDQLVSFHRRLGRDENELRRVIMDILRDKDGKGTGLDHGIMGALLLLGNSRFDFEVVAPAASAIALHNKLSDIASVDKIHFEKHPLAFILIYCDLLHEWARDVDEDEDEIVPGSEFPRLKDFVITATFDELPTQGISEMDLEAIRQGMEGKECVFASIQIDSYVAEKLEEARHKFDKLKSESVCFVVKINNRTFFTTNYLK